MPFRYEKIGLEDRVFRREGSEVRPYAPQFHDRNLPVFTGFRAGRRYQKAARRIGLWRRRTIEKKRDGMKFSELTLNRPRKRRENRFHAGAHVNEAISAGLRVLVGFAGQRGQLEIRATTRSINRASSGPAFLPASSTSSCVIGAPETPAAAFETRARARTSMPA